MDALTNALEENEGLASNDTQEQSQSQLEKSNNNDNSNEKNESHETTTTNNGIKENTESNEKPPENNPKPSPEDAKWHTVGIYNGLSASVNSYIDNNVWTSACSDLNSESVPDLANFPRINLEPGTAYRFRIRAINSCGAGEWSEVSSFKTCLPGFPGAPSAIKISKSSEGAHLTWEPPPSCTNSNEIIEYSVYLAVKPGRDKEGKEGTQPRTPAQLAFVRVYVGSANQCTVSHSALTAAHVDCSNKPAIIFRIAARNDKGYGPATQVRWLQDAMQNATANNSSSGGNNANQSSMSSPQRGAKVEQIGQSPIKRFKSTSGHSLLAPEM